jgi:TetR/AcrR family transcriptional regulator, regulator of cefoperazone and chloramphenicol sensitivity
MPKTSSPQPAVPNGGLNPPPKPQRSDGIEARERLIRTALRLFARHGYEKTSTRMICDEACVNVSAIAYYFGDKAALYRAAFCEPLGEMSPHGGDIDPAMPLRTALQLFYREMLAPLTQGELVQDCMRLHFREMVEPTGLWAQEVDNEIKPQHRALVNYFRERFAMAEADLELHRMVFAIVGMAVHMFVGREIIQDIEPRVIATAAAVTATADGLAEFALAIVTAEGRRRGIELSA